MKLSAPKIIILLSRKLYFLNFRDIYVSIYYFAAGCEKHFQSRKKVKIYVDTFEPLFTKNKLL